MKRLWSKLSLVLLISCMVLSACDGNGGNGNTSSMSDGGIYKAGIYTGSGEGINGAVTVEVTFSDEEITDIKVI
ncbi:FMN-binding protein [Paenibacillus bouchesdurhonensis]|uniref:FMN-binding protein n=1 Tax=Paenibacillus bouchesdurhonensis TaxID=1870990 RepID=UPI00190084B0|nr:hypothetical protein [Paenibacillus bouchesdurhonensis]